MQFIDDYFNTDKHIVYYPKNIENTSEYINQLKTSINWDNTTSHKTRKVFARCRIILRR